MRSYIYDVNQLTATCLFLAMAKLAKAAGMPCKITNITFRIGSGMNVKPVQCVCVCVRARACMRVRA